MDKYTVRSILAALAFFGPILGYGLFGTYLEASATLATLILAFVVVGQIFLVGCIGTGIERVVRYLLTNKGAG
jgi:hypothetical protein